VLIEGPYQGCGVWSVRETALTRAERNSQTNSNDSKAFGLDATSNGGGARWSRMLRCFNCLRSGIAKRLASVGVARNQYRIPGMRAMDRVFS